MENHSIDPFKVLNIPYEFEIKELDKIYYTAYKKNENLEKINFAYKILKDPIKRLFFLCALNDQTENNQEILKFVMELIKEKKYSNETCQEILNQSIEFAKQKKWSQCWEELQKYQYLKKLVKE